MTDWVSSFPEAEDARSKAADLAAKKRAWVSGTELTSAQLAEVQPNLKRDMYARQQATA